MYRNNHKTPIMTCLMHKCNGWGEGTRTALIQLTMGSYEAKNDDSVSPDRVQCSHISGDVYASIA